MSTQPKIGDRVRANALALLLPWSGGKPFKLYAGLEGNIVAKTPDNNPNLKWGIEFDYPIVDLNAKLTGYYSCFGKGNLGYCMYLEEKCFDIIEEKICAPSEANTELFPMFNDFSEELFDKIRKERVFEEMDKAYKEISDARSLPFNYSKEDELILIL